MNSPVGQLTLIASEQGLAAILWENDNLNRVHAKADIHNATHPTLIATEQQLNEYFARQRNQFTIPLDPIGTPFQKAVWKALETIPYGETRTYSQLAQQLGNPTAARAVGAANGKNPISIIVPCHRVIGASGSLTGFAGGLEAKACLLALEGATTNNSKQLTIPL